VQQLLSTLAETALEKPLILSTDFVFFIFFDFSSECADTDRFMFNSSDLIIAYFDKTAFETDDINDFYV
jgi:hypothetical protein